MAVQTVAAPLSGRFRVRVTARSGGVLVTAADSSHLSVEAGPRAAIAVEEGDADRPTAVEVTSSSNRVEITCPPGTDVVVGNSSGKVRFEGTLGHVRVTSRSGSVEIEDAVSVDVRSGSGRVIVESCEGQCRVMSRSGSIEVGRVGSLDAAVKSGRLAVDQVGKARVYSGSGSVELGATGEGDLEIRVMSGSVKVDVPAGARPDLRAKARSGRVRCDCEEGDDFVVDVATHSGAVTVQPS